jgi:YHS domain-containing protein
MKRHKARYKGLLGVAVLAATAAVLLLPMGATAIVAGAGYSTSLSDDTCVHGTVINCNAYAAKTDVYVSGGPTAGGITTAGSYYFAILAPGSQNGGAADGAVGNLSSLASGCAAGDTAADRTFTVGFDLNGNPIIATNDGSHADDTNSAGKFVIQASDFCDTPNEGGVYILAICTSGSADPADCKFDAFKAPDSDCVVDCEPDPFGAISGLKYYDVDLSGTFTSGDLPIPGWKIDYWDGTSDTLVTEANGEFSVTLSGDTYYFAEEHPTNTTGAPFNLPLWVQTGNISQQTSYSDGDSSVLNSFVYEITHTDTGSTSGVYFGNVCLGTGGGLTLGFWSNKNGQAQMNDGGTLAPELALLSGLNLRTANGADFNPTTYAAFRTWILGATATNMAYMLSAQLAAMTLNVEAGFVSATSSVYVAGIGLVTIGNLTAEANRVLANPIVGSPFAGLNGSVTVAASALRTYQEQLKSGLDAGNNNVNFVQQPTNGSLPACASTAIAGWTTAFPTP